MPIAFMFQSDAVDQAGYDLAMKGIGRESVDAPSPEGFIAHISGAKPGGGWQVVDVWETEDAANAFYGSPTFQDGVVKVLPAIDVTPWPLYRLEVDRTIKHKT